MVTPKPRGLIDFFRNLLWLKKLMIFEQILMQILRAYVNIWSKNLRRNMPKMAILLPNGVSKEVY